MNAKRIIAIAALFLAPHANAQAPNLEAMDIVLRSVPNGPVAKVFGENISSADFVRLYQMQVSELTAENQGEALKTEDRVQLARWCLRGLIEQELLYQEGKRRAIKVSKSDTEDAWNKRLDALKKNLELTGDQATEKAVLARLGFATKKEALGEVARALLIARTRSAIVEELGIEIDEERVQAVYEKAKGQLTAPGQIHLKHIFIRAEKGEGESARRQREDARRRAEDTLARIDAGQSFEGIVRSVSEAPDKATGGDLGPARPEELPPYLVEAARGLGPDEVSDVIESDLGFHIVKLVSRSGEAPDLDQVAPAIRQRLLAREGELAVRQYFNEQISNPDDVQIFLELEKNLAIDPEYRNLGLK